MKTLGLAGMLLIGAAATAAGQKPPAAKAESIPDQYKPPKGMCRIWLQDVPAQQQPAPTDCAAAVKNNPPNGRVIFGEPAEKKDKPKDPPPAAKSFTGKSAAKVVPPVVKKPPTER